MMSRFGGEGDHEANDSSKRSSGFDHGKQNATNEHEELIDPEWYELDEVSGLHLSTGTS